jgi:hypothetical protein
MAALVCRAHQSQLPHPARTHYSEEPGIHRFALLIPAALLGAREQGLCADVVTDSGGYDGALTLAAIAEIVGHSAAGSAVVGSVEVSEVCEALFHDRGALLGHAPARALTGECGT